MIDHGQGVLLAQTPRGKRALAMRKAFSEIILMFVQTMHVDVPVRNGHSEDMALGLYLVAIRLQPAEDCHSRSTELLETPKALCALCDIFLIILAREELEDCGLYSHHFDSKL